MQPVLFLDIDGVLNGHDYCAGAQSNTIRPSAIAALNLILDEVKPQIVVSSAWRYMLLGRKPAMTLTGFEYMLRTHGVCGIVGRIIGTTCADEDCPHCGHRHRKGRGNWNDKGYFQCAKCGQPSARGHQITRWLKDNRPAMHDLAAGYAVLDDEDYEIDAEGHPLVLTDGKIGLTIFDASKVIELLT